MSFPSEVIARLAAQGVGTFGTNMFIGSGALLPAGDGPYLVLIDTGGSGASRTQTNTATENPTAQISTRAKSPSVARTMLQAAYTALGGANGLHNVTLSGTYYLSLTSRQNATDIGVDDAGRAMVAFNIDAEKEPS